MTPQRRALIVVALGGLIGLATSLWAYQWLQDVTEQTRLDMEAKSRTIPIAVAAADLAWGAVLADDAVRMVPFPADTVPEGHFASAETLKGRVVIMDVKQHEPILESKLAPATVTSGGVAAVTHPEKRAVAVKVDDVVAVGGFIKPGDRVDVLTTVRRPGKTDDPVTKVVLENVRVLAMGQDTERAAQTDKAAKNQETKLSVPSVMTLEVAPDEAEKLALASTEGKVQLALRNPQSVTAVATTGATISSLLASFGGEAGLRKEPSPTPSNRTQARATPRPTRVPVPPRPAGSPTDESGRNLPPITAAPTAEPMHVPVIAVPVPVESPITLEHSPSASSVLADSLRFTDSRPPIEPSPSSPPSPPAAKGLPPVSVELIKGMTRDQCRV
jgi:pilus assembly protein CpaB